jgi:hypothetical protein
VLASRMRRIAPILLILLTTAGAARAAPPPAYDPAWAVETPKDAPATLIHGVPATVGFACQKGSGQVEVRLVAARTLADHRNGETSFDAAGVPAPWPASIAFASGTDATTLRGHAEPNPAGPGSVLTTEISTAAPVIKAFARTGMISLTALGETTSEPPVKPGLVRKFLGVCR